MNQDSIAEFTKPKKIRKDRRHNQPTFFDDDSDQHKTAGRRGHSRMKPDSMPIEIDEDHPYGEFADWKKFLR